MSHAPAALPIEPLDTNASPILDGGISGASEPESGPDASRRVSDDDKNIRRGRGRPRGSLNRIPAQGRKPKPQPPELARLGVRWYVAETHPQAERWVAQDLARAGWTAYLPLTVVWRRDRVLPTQIHREVVPLMPGFVFVQFDRDERAWGTIIDGCKGVRSILGSVTGRPSPVSAAEIKWLRDEAQGGEEARLQLKAAGPNEPRVVGGVVTVPGGIPGVVASCDGLTTVVSVEMFGRVVQVSVPWGQVDAA